MHCKILCRYTTSLDSFLSIAGIYYIYKQDHHEPGYIFNPSVSSRFIAAVFFSLATMARSNSVLLVVFQIFVTCHKLLSAYTLQEFSIRMLIQEGIVLAITGLIHVIPIPLYLYYASSTFCSLDPVSSYCNSLFPNIYNYVQSSYWYIIVRNVGLFRYWELKQIPNFLLAVPMMYISLSAIYNYIRLDLKRAVSFSTSTSVVPYNSFFANPLILPFILYWILNLGIVVFIANIQIITRMFASFPVVYWFVGERIMEGDRWYLLYFLVYICVGSILFSNFYPWT